MNVTAVLVILTVSVSILMEVSRAPARMVLVGTVSPAVIVREYEGALSSEGSLKL